MNANIEQRLKELQLACEAGQPLNQHAVANLCGYVGMLQSDELQQFMANRMAEIDDNEELRSTDWWQASLTAIGHSRLTTCSGFANQITDLYSAASPACDTRFQLLTFLARSMPDDQLSQFVKLICDDPPRGSGPATTPFLPFFGVRKQSAGELFPGLLSALDNPEVAPAVLDLANFLVRERITDSHPATSRAKDLVHLLEAITSGLERVQSSGPEDTEAKQEQVAISVPLAISLCDALALIGEDTAIPTLMRVSELQHRRLKLESVAALARLGDEEKQQELLQLAEEPNVRLRVLAYAQELGLLEQVAEEFRNPQSRAESQLVAFLSQPSQMGIPPTKIECVDSRTLFWPGYETPQKCFLFEFEYNAVSPEGQLLSYTNHGIAGPVAHAFHADITGQPLEDQYAAFAGWQAEHPDIQQHEADLGSQTPAIRHLCDRLATESFQNVDPQIVGSFFSDDVLVATAAYSGIDGTVIADQRETFWFPTEPSSPRPLGPSEAYLIYKGKRLLKSFNG